MSGFSGALPLTPAQQDLIDAQADIESRHFGYASQTMGSAQAIDTTGRSWSSGAWWQQLQPGSWRGVGFVLDSGQTAAGRRIALHEYPYRDDAWAEDLGKLPPRFVVQGFLVGDDVYRQRDAMLHVVEQAGSGTLVHPTLGSIQCVLLEFSATDRRERGRYVELQFSFIRSGDVQYPSTSIATGSAVSSCCRALSYASQVDLGAALAPIAIVPEVALATVAQFTGLAVSAVNDASRIIGAVRGLQGYHGRYANGALSTLQSVDQTVRGALALATTTRSAVYLAADTVNRVASVL